MTTTAITGALLDSVGTGISNATVTCTLVTPDRGVGHTASGEIVAAATLLSDVMGIFELDLVPTSAITPVDSYYYIEAQLNLIDPPLVWKIIVPATGGPYALGDPTLAAELPKIDPPATLYQQVPLKVTRGDTKIVPITISSPLHTGHILQAQARTDVDQTPIFAATCALDVTTGIGSLTWPSTQTATMLIGTYYWDVKLIDTVASPVVSLTFAGGPFEVFPNITAS